MLGTVFSKIRGKIGKRPSGAQKHRHDHMNAPGTRIKVKDKRIGSKQLLENTKPTKKKFIGDYEETELNLNVPSPGISVLTNKDDPKTFHGKNNNFDALERMITIQADQLAEVTRRISELEETQK